MTSKDQTAKELKRLDRKICCVNNNLINLLSEDIIAALEGATNPDAGNVFITQEDLDNYDPVMVVANYAALPDPATVAGEFYWAEASQGTQWLPGSLGGTYYPLGIYYSNGVSWTHIETPYQATQPTVDAGLNDNQFVTPLTLKNSSQWDTKLNVVDLRSNLILYPTTVASDIPTYYKLVTDIHDADFDDPAVDINTGVISGPSQLIASLATVPGLLLGNPGTFNITIVGNIRKISGSGVADFYFEVYKRDNLGNETLIGTSSATPAVTGVVYEQFDATAIWDDGIFVSTDRIVFKFYSNRIPGGSNPEYQFQFGGIYPVRAIVPVPFSIIGYTKSEIDSLLLNKRDISTYVYKSALYTVTDTDRTIECNGTFAVTLPLLSSITHREDITIKNSGSGIITIQTTGGELLDDTTSFPIYSRESLTLQKGNTTYIAK